MAYNREWDRGKQFGYDSSSSWQYQGSRHSREDDYQTDVKRRKYNTGGYDTSQAYDDGSYEAGYSDFPQDNSEERHRGPGFQSSKKRLVPSDPSPHVIFLGLDTDFTEADLQAYLSSNSCSVESVTIIRDRSTGVSKGFGFAQFTSTEHARAFVDPLFPFIHVPPPASHGASATAAFYKALESGSPAPPGGRRVKIDFSQSASPAEKRGRIPQSMNDGTRDIGNAQSPVLLFRGLDPLSGPQAIAQAMKTSAGPGKDGAKGMRRIILIKDKVTMASWGFAFVEFVDIQSASAVLALTMSPQIHPSGFRISDKPVAASFAHPYSFQPVPDHVLRDDACLSSTASLGGMEGAYVRYWDEASTAAVLEFKVQDAPTPALPVPKEREKKKKPKSENEGNAQAHTAASALLVTDKPLTLSFKGALNNKTGSSSSVAPLPAGFSMGDDVPGENSEIESEEQVPSGDPKVFISKKVAPLIASKKIANNITKWNQVQEVLSNDSPVPVAEPAPGATIAGTDMNTVPGPAVSADTEFEFSDLIAMTCLLCARQFKSLDQLNRHNQQSDLHKRNHADANLREIAREKAKTARAKADQPRYRDRASERRVMHNQPEVPLPESSKPIPRKRQAEGPPKPPTPPPPPVNPGQDDTNMGNKLLEMMGWKEGTGLGTDGEGRVDPVHTAMYAQGVGLGASKAKDIGRYTEGYSGYVNMVQDAARERFNDQ